MQNLDTIIKFLSFLGLDFEESKIYLTLLEKGGMTVLEISRITKVSRTNVYRLVEKLKTEGLIEEIQRSSKKILMPVGAHKLEMLVKEQESKAEYLRKFLPELSTIIPATNSISQPETKVMFYKGVEGIKQMVWNTLKAEGECVGYSYRTIAEIVGEDFAESWYTEFRFRKLRFRDLIGDEYLKSINQESPRKVDNPNFDSRFISKDVLDINHQVDIYNDIVAYYTWHEGEIFGVEIHNKKVAKLQKQLFEAIWRLGVTLE
jgi:sugar-specific transcriptional regulator TrmB